MSSDYGNGKGREGGHRMSDLISREAALAIFQPEHSAVRKRICDDLRALPAVHIHTTKAAPAVKVKPLVWSGKDADFTRADCLFGRAEIFNAYDGRFVVTLNGTQQRTLEADSMDGAKALWFKEYEARILATLEGGAA